jgi:ligand-binding sensor domain-containing protein
MTKKGLLLLSVLMCCISIVAWHVPVRIVSQTPVEGAEEARCLKFDHNGLMWIGTDLGVCAYDGYRFRTYRNDAY